MKHVLAAPTLLMAMAVPDQEFSLSCRFRNRIINCLRDEFDFKMRCDFVSRNSRKVRHEWDTLVDYTVFYVFNIGTPWPHTRYLIYIIV